MTTKKRKPALRKKRPLKKAAATTSARAVLAVPTGDEITQSVAFRRAAMDAEAYVRDPQRLRKLVEDAVGKINVIPRGPFAETWPYLMAMIRLIRAYHQGEYRDISSQNLLIVLAAIIY